MHKTCFKCGETKPITEFYRHPQMADEHLNKCKECTKLDATKNRVANIDYYRKYDRDRGNRQSPEYIKNWRDKNPEKYAAHIFLNNSLRDRKIIRPNHCSRCLTECVPHGHHDDYSQPLVVTWLCASCHKLEHAA